MRYLLILIFLAVSLLTVQAQQDKFILEDAIKLDQNGQSIWLLRHPFRRFCLRYKDEFTMYPFLMVNLSLKDKYFVLTANYVSNWKFKVKKLSFKFHLISYHYKAEDARLMLKLWGKEFDKEPDADALWLDVLFTIINNLEPQRKNHNNSRRKIIEQEKLLKRSVELDQPKWINEALEKIEQLEKEDDGILKIIEKINESISRSYREPHGVDCTILELDVILFHRKAKEKPQQKIIPYEEVEENKEEKPGIRICVNDDDDDNDFIKDKSDSEIDGKVLGDDDLAQAWYFWARPLETSVFEESALKIQTNSAKIKFWKMIKKAEQIQLPIEEESNYARKRLFIEAIEPSNTARGEFVEAVFEKTFLRYIHDTCKDKGNMTNIGIKFLDKDKKELDETTQGLHIGKWVWKDGHAFTRDDPQSEKDVKDDFVGQDPDHFYVKVIDKSEEEKDHVVVKIKSLKADGAKIDPEKKEAVEVALEGEGGVFVSQPMLLMSDVTDDKFKNSATGNVEDDNRGDLTYRALLSGHVVAEYEIEGKHKCENRIQVCKGEVKEVHLNVKILRMKKGGDPVALPTDVLLYDIPRTQERFAQCCMTVTVTVETVDPPAGVTFGEKDGLDFELRDLSVEEKALYHAYGTRPTNDIVVFYVNWLQPPERVEDKKDNVGLSTFTNSTAYFNSLDDPDYSTKFANNIIISTVWRRPFTLAHELMHILMNAEHYKSGKQFLLFFSPTSPLNYVYATKRITEDECKTMKDKGKDFLK